MDKKNPPSLHRDGGFYILQMCTKIVKSVVERQLFAFCFYNNRFRLINACAK